MKVVIEDIGWSAELADLLPSTRMRNLQTRAQVAEAKLAKAVEALIELADVADDNLEEKVSARTTLAELKEKRMTEVANIEVVSETILEDGGALYTFDVDNEAACTLGEIGLKLLLYCAALEITVEEAFETLLKTWPLEDEV